ncbi:hypothetical protein EMPS_07380 [Entomortierella parvispora]|uniref:Uncharacterized protein n=1 Tax=Entomortierella parvispora TaxID=205924 RepID=A0A9P3LYD7_9FUNG|nr:hypothetical protein EMPS_07380 [Entomortierella parvispora]
MNNNAHPAGSSGADGSLTETLKGYINVAMAKGQEALEQAKVLGHKAQEQLNEAVAQAHTQASTHANDASGNTHAQSSQYNSGSTYPGQQTQSTANNAFSDLNQFNNNANNAAQNATNQASNAAKQASDAAHNAAANAGYKSSQRGL